MKDREKELNKQKFKQMSFKKKVEHIWEYDRITILATLIGIGIVTSLLYSAFGPKPPEYAVNIVVAGKAMTDLRGTAVDTEKINTQYDADLMLFTVDFDTTSGETSAIEQKILLMLQTGDLEILALPVDKYEGYLSIEGYNLFMPLDEQEALREVLEAHEEGLVIQENKEKDGQNVFGVRLQSLEAFKDIHVSEDLIIGIIAQVEEKEKTLEVFKYLLEADNE